MELSAIQIGSWDLLLIPLRPWESSFNCALCALLIHLRNSLTYYYVLQVVVCMWLLSVIGSYFSFFTLAYIGMQIHL